MIIQNNSEVPSKGGGGENQGGGELKIIIWKDCLIMCRMIIMLGLRIIYKIVIEIMKIYSNNNSTSKKKINRICLMEITTKIKMIKLKI